MFPNIKSYCESVIEEFHLIPESRKILLSKLSDYILKKKLKNEAILLMYVCTHNSRRSQFGQIWAKVAAQYYHMDSVSTFSGGTEATAFHSNAINALTRIGFRIEPSSGAQQANPIYKISYASVQEDLLCFSKIYDDETNPQNHFAAIMTCSEAEENCPFIPGVDLRLASTYEDPKAFDHTELCELKYDERCKQIARETFYAFHLVQQQYDKR